MEMLDFRSDTVTRPTETMRQAMARAEVGDDVYGDDPTVNELQAYAARLLGMEDALYVPSGTMGNLLALMSHCERGEGVMMGVRAHTWKNEGGGPAFLAGLMPYPLDDEDGIPRIESIDAAFLPEGNVHFAATKLLALENTHNAAGGAALSPGDITRVARHARSLGMKVHIDGARIFNACAYYDADVAEYTREVDSIQVCLSKGLCAPMGSLLCGSGEFIARARKYRKAMGGGQRQVGIAAAAGLVALRDMRGRLKEDHARAALLADLLSSSGVDVDYVASRTNMVHISLSEKGLDSAAAVELCRGRNLLLGATGPRRLRMVTHHDVDERAVRAAAAIVAETICR